MLRALIGGAAAHSPEGRTSRTSSQKKRLKTGRYDPERTGDLSTHGRKNSSRIEQNIASTPHSFAGRMKSTVKERRIA